MTTEPPAPIATPGVPRAAAVLGALGLIPFLGLAVLSTAGGATDDWARFALTAYGAAILSFLGGIYWGFATTDGRAAWSRLLLAVVPSLVAWGAMMAPPGPALLVLVAGFVLMLSVDIAAARAGHAPRWYPALRMPLTVIACAALLFAWW